MVDGKKGAGYSIVSFHDLIETQPLPTNTSAQLSELVILTRAPEPTKRKRVTIYTDLTQIDYPSSSC